MRPWVLCLLPLAVFGQTATPRGPAFSGPMFGWVWDGSAGTVRRVSGVPGAASLDAGSVLPVSLSRAWVSVGGATLGVAKDTGKALVVRQGAAAPVELKTQSACDLGAIARSGQFAVLYDRAASEIEIWSKLDTEPERKARFKAASVTAVAIADDGRVAASRGWDVFLAAATGETPLATVDKPVAALAWAGDGRLAAAYGKQVAILGAGGGPPAKIEIPAAPDRLQSLEGEAAFAVSQPGTGGFWVLDASTSTPRITPLPGSSWRTK